MRRKRSWLMAALLFFVLAGACAKSETSQRAGQNNEVLARVGQFQITSRMMQEAMKEQHARYQRLFSSNLQKQTLLRELILFSILAKEAKQKGLFKHPKVLHARRQAALYLLKQRLRRRWSESHSSSSFRAFYLSWLKQ
ncbi:MAG: SurA N-terminal domain-containing protein, partial [Myxococcota bacterium]